MPKELALRTQRWSRFVSLVSVIAALLAINAVVWGMRAIGDLVAAFSLGSSIVIGFVATIRPFLLKPRLDLFVPDPQCSKPSEEKDTASWFVRLGIVNYGLTPAKDCVGRLLSVWTAEGEQLTKFDPLTLFWARQDKESTGFNPVVIQGGGDFEYLDIAQVKRADTTPLALRVVVPRPMTLTKWPPDYPSPGVDPVLKAGTYYLLISVHAADAYIKPSWFEITCDAVVPDSCDEKAPCRIRKAAPRLALG